MTKFFKQDLKGGKVALKNSLKNSRCVCILIHNLDNEFYHLLKKEHDCSFYSLRFPSASSFLPAGSSG